MSILSTTRFCLRSVSGGNFEDMIKGGVKVPEGFSYTSDNNKEWMTIPQLQQWIEQNRHKIGSI